MTDYSPEGVSRWMLSLGRTAFEAYVESVGGTTYDGGHIPAWEKLTDAVRQGWSAAALAAIAVHTKALEADRG